MIKIRKRKVSHKNHRFIFGVVVLLIFVGMGVGFSYLSANLSINGTTAVSKNTWDVHFQNIRVASDSVNASTPATIDPTGTGVRFSVNLGKPGNVYSFTVDVVNTGSIDAMVNGLTKSTLTDAQSKYLEYIVTYNNGRNIIENELLPINASRKVKVTVKYKKDIQPADLPVDTDLLNLSFNIEYVQSDETGIEPKFLCKRATTLHTEECTQTDSEQYCSGAGYIAGGSKGTTTITYGNLGTNGTLNSGDAFDCDVNGDGVYDAATERFYYVSDLDTNSNYAVLIYYNNVVDGYQSNTTAFAYNTDNSSYLGPQTVMLELPTNTQWKNVSLLSTTIDIKDEDGTVRVSNFSYEGYAARLLTTQEIETACNITVGNRTRGELDSCNYLMENTRYSSSNMGSSGFWLQSVRYGFPGHAWGALGGNRCVNVTSVGTESLNGTRPAIEVLKSNISY